MGQLNLFKKNTKKTVSLKEAAEWASQYTNHQVTASNISYLLQYGRIKKYNSNGFPLVDIEELKNYYDYFSTISRWKRKFGDDINWHLSFIEYKESERTNFILKLHRYLICRL